MRRLCSLAWVRQSGWAAASVGLAAAAFGQAPGTAAPRLLPQPREVRAVGSMPLSAGVVVNVPGGDAEDQFAAAELRRSLEERGIATTGSAGTDAVQIELLRSDTEQARSLLRGQKVAFADAMRAEGYAIVPEPRGVAVVAASAAGEFYGAQTLAQCVEGRGTGAMLWTAVVRDWPAMQWRGISDDISRGPLPTLEFQKEQIRAFAQFKMNVYSPYFENTFAFASDPLGAAPDGAMSADDLRELVAYAEPYHVVIVPEQEAFGHLHNLFVEDIYADMAETPRGDVIAPGNSAAIPLIREWFGELAALTPGPYLHIGADETFDLGKGKTAAEVQRRGLGAVYVDFLNQIDTALKPTGKQLMFWGDVAMNDPSLVPKIPKDMIAVPWVYDPQPKGFDQFILPFKQAGITTWVAPSVNNWSKLYPDEMRGLTDIQQFVRDGQRLGSVGTLNTTWNDDGEGLFNLDWYGVIFGASAAWQPGESPIAPFQAKYGTTFHGDTSGKVDQAMAELIAADALLKDDPYLSYTDRLYWIDPWSAAGQAEAARLRPLIPALRLHAEHAAALLIEAQKEPMIRHREALAAMEMAARRLDFVGLKFQTSDEIAASYAKAVALSKTPGAKPDDVDVFLYKISDTNGWCQDLRNGYATQRDLYERAWLVENRRFALARVLGQYDLAAQLWISRANSINNAMDDFHRDHVLPSAASIGIPEAAAH